MWIRPSFSDARYKDRDSAAEAVDAADKLAKMAKHPGKMSAKDISEFNQYLEKYHNDLLFSERFAKGLGGKGTLQFWTDMVNAHAGARGSELESLEKLQTNLSLTLATASFSDSDGMKAWKTDLLKEMNTSFRSESKDPFQSPVGALGSQVLSSLMRKGAFDPEFRDDSRSHRCRPAQGAGWTMSMGSRVWGLVLVRMSVRVQLTYGLRASVQSWMVWA